MISVYGMSTSGNCHKVRLLLEQTGRPYRWIETDSANGATRTPEGLLPFVLLLNIHFWAAIIFPIFVFLGLILLMRRKIQGYTGDCCGAMFLLCELSFFLGISIILKLC